jgi:beta-lactamase class A
MKLGTVLDQWPGTVSVWLGPVGSPTPAFARQPDAPHYAASTMKVAVLAALYRSRALDDDVVVVNDFASAAAGAPRFRIGRDGDGEVWDRLGQRVTLRWLARRMIVASSNLATNLILAHIGIDAVQGLLRDIGLRNLRVERGIEDSAARVAGLDNVITARDLAALLSVAVADDAIRDVLLAQEEPTVGLPPGTKVAHKGGWVTGVRHSAAVVFPPDAQPYVVIVATTSPDRNDDAARHLIAQVHAASWAARHTTS